MKQRSAYLDYLKFIAMFLVVVYHTPPRYDTAHEAALFNMGAPIFFFAAGYLFNIARQSSFWAFLKHRARQLLVPYTTFFIVFYLLWLFVGRRMAGPDEMAIDTLTPVWQFLKGTPDVVLGPFWFIAALFTMQIIYWPIAKLVKNAKASWALLIITLILNLSLFILPDVQWLRLWNLDKALLYMPIYALGNFLGDRNRDAQAKAPTASSWPLRIVAAAVGLGFLIVAPLNIDRDVAYVLAPEAVILCLPLYVGACKWFEHRFGTSRIAQVVAITGITYLAVQNYLIGIIKMVVARVMGEGIFDNNIVLKVAIAIVVMAAIYPIALFVERYMPWMLGKRHQKSK